jgi:predicted dehydrogenase
MKPWSETMEKPVKVALVGLGFMGKTHLGVYQKLSGVEVAAMCDASRKNLEFAKLETSGNIQTATGAIDLGDVRKYTDYAELLAAGGFDFVDICSPTHLHAEQTITALDAGYNVLCEKPMALSVQETERILEKVKRSGKLFSVAQCLRYWPAYSEVKKLINSGAYGKVKSAEFARFSAPPRWASSDWLRVGALSGNAALDLHIHDVDMVLHLFGVPQAVRSNGIFENDGSISHISTLYTYPDLLVQATGGWICSDSFGFTMRAFYILENATIELDFSKSPAVTVFPNGDAKYALPLPEGDGYYFELKDFVEGIRKGNLSGIVTGRSAADSVRVCLLEIESARARREITLGSS